MFCNISQMRYSDFSEKIMGKVAKERIPYMGTLELTYRCNLSCCHCYCNLKAGDDNKRRELSTSEVKRVLDEISDSGCLWLCLTGGEVLLREDFREIYLHALKRGMLIEIFTNATLITEDMAELFSEFPPFGIDISIYGASATMHDRITGVSGSFDKMIAGMELLKEHKVRFSLKTVLMTLNLSDLYNIKELARAFGAEYRFDTVISPRLNGEMQPCAYRLSADEMVRIDIEEDLESCEWIFTNFWNKQYDEPTTCGAGNFSFNINPYGIVSPCTMFTSFQYSLKETAFGNLWRRLSNDYRSKSKYFAPPECGVCSMILICSHCSAAAELEVKRPDKTVGYICDYAKRLEEVYFIKKKEAEDAKKAV